MTRKQRSLEEAQRLNEHAHALLRDGHVERAMAAFARGEREFGRAYPSFAFNLACCQAVRGDTRRALDSLKRALKQGYNNWDNLNADYRVPHREVDTSRNWKSPWDRVREHRQ